MTKIDPKVKSLLGKIHALVKERNARYYLGLSCPEIEVRLNFFHEELKRVERSGK